MTAQEIPTDPTIRALLLSARQRRGLTMQAAVRLIDTTERTYRSWERDGVVPAERWSDRIAEFCGVSRYVVLAAMGILTAHEAEILDREIGVDIPG